jgi:hypothetical protein
MIENTVVKIPKLVSTETATKSNVTEENTHAQSYKLLKEHLPLITCVCGAEILLVPDLDAMNLAIKAHVSQHRKNRTDAQGKENTSGSISQLLSQLVLMKLTEINGI